MIVMSFTPGLVWKCCHIQYNVRIVYPQLECTVLLPLHTVLCTSNVSIHCAQSGHGKPVLISIGLLTLFSRHTLNAVFLRKLSNSNQAGECFSFLLACCMW
jgi:hypothetical protein